MIADRTVEEVRDRADLVELVGEEVQLRKSGREWKGCCPFHEDRTPSFYVVPDKGFFKCFGCGESGDIFAWVMKRHGMDFTDAIRHLAGRYGIEVVEIGGDGDGESDPLRPYYEANAFARDWFRSRLEDEAAGAPARAYLEARGIGGETAERFGLGFAPEGWRGFREHAASHGWSEELLLEVGLLTTSAKANEPYDRFRGRLIFPIESIRGKVVAFGGRVIGPEAKGVPKYLNSPESPVYHKGRTLYALGWNRNSIRREEVALVVEGYMDVVSLAAVGVENAVATLGTAMTEDQAVLLRRYTRRALLLFDSDEAGMRATFRAGDALLAAGVHPSVVSFPPGEDPDSVVRGEGAGAFRRYLGEAVDLLDRKIQLLEERGYFESVDGVRRALDKLLPTVRLVSDAALRDLYVAKVAERTGVRRETVEAEAAQTGRDSSSRHRATDDGRSRTAGGRATDPHRRPAGGARGRLPRGVPTGLGPERQLLLVLLHARDWVDRAAERVGPGDFTDDVHREIFERLLDDPGLGPATEGLSPAVRDRLEVLLGSSEELEHTERVFEAAVAMLRDRALEVRKEEMERSLRSAGSPEEQRRILGDLGRLRRERPGRWNVVRRDRPGEQHQETDGMDQ
jgi:DNA primase